LSRLAYQQFEDNMDIRRSEIVTDPRGRQTLNPSTPLIASTRSEDHPHYSPDGSKIAFVSNRSGTWELWVSDSDGSKALRITFMDGPIVLAPRWSPDGRRIAFFATTGISGKYQSWIVNAAGGPPQRLMPDDSDLQALPNWSSDGRWIYFGSGRSGSLQVWKVPVDGGPLRQVTTGGGVDSAESPDGKSVYYAKVPEVGPGLWSVPVDGGQELQVLSEARFGYWALAKSGIYYIDFSVGHDTTKPVNFFRFDTRETTHIGNVEASVSWRNNSGFAVSPDGRWLLYSNLQSGSADLMLLDNFR
jgi:Tol biopolymer transport system component